MRSRGMGLPQKRTSFSPCMALRITPRTAEKVVDLMPPPVPEGEAPMTMRRTTRSTEAFARPPVGMVLKPTVVMAVMAWKKAASRRSSTGIRRMEGSVRKMRAVPPALSQKVVQRMILLVRVISRILPRSIRQKSTQTMKPIAPR